MCIFKKVVFMVMIFFLIVNVNVNIVYVVIDVSVKSVIVIDGVLGRVLFVKDEYEKRWIVSIIKIMMVVFVIEFGKMDEMVMVLVNVVRIEGFVIYLIEG